MDAFTRVDEDTSTTDFSIQLKDPIVGKNIDFISRLETASLRKREEHRKK